MNWWNENKLKLSLVPAATFWVVSMLCFVVGLSFKNPIGFMIWKWDVSVWIAFALSIANTIIQVIGNGQGRAKMGNVMFTGWISSYILGISSNVNTLLGILHIDNDALEWAVAVSLGWMIEVMPERLLVTFIESFVAKKKEHKRIEPLRPVQEKYVPKHKPILGGFRLPQSNQPNQPKFPKPAQPTFIPRQGHFAGGDNEEEFRPVNYGDERR